MSLTRVLVAPLLGYFLYCTKPVAASYSVTDVHSDPASSLLDTLQNFAKTRNHITSPTDKYVARDFIKKSFQDFGLHVWSENVSYECVQKYYGENIVGMLQAKRTNTTDDKIVIVGAHYDTTDSTLGVDDNGSGVTALLQVAKQVASANFELKNTIMFVAFDFEENVNTCESGLFDGGGLVGSARFVQNLTSYLHGTGGTVNGAFVFESVLNYNSSEGSQQFPAGIEHVLEKTYDEVKNDSFRGNFIIVVGRSESDKKLLSLMEKYYEKDSNYRAQLAKIPLSGRPSLAPNMMNYNDFYRSDHFKFWNNNVSYSALMLTDTTEFRGFMKFCYHRMCDNLDQVKDDDLEFMRRTINAVIQSVLNLSEANAASTSVVSLLVFLPLVIMACLRTFIAVN